MAKASTRSETERVLSKEEYPAPSSKKGYSTLIDEILRMPGGVQRMILEKGQPVRVWRWVEQDEMYEGAPTLEMALANVEIIEYVNPDPHRTAPEELFHMLAVMRKESHQPVCWVTGGQNTGLLRSWLRVEEQGVPFDEGDLLNIQVERLKSIPEDTLLLCGAPHVSADFGEVTLAVKTAIEVREVVHVREERERDAARGGHHPEEHGPRTREAQATPRGDSREGWDPPRFIRERLSGGSQVHR